MPATKKDLQNFLTSEAANLITGSLLGSGFSISEEDVAGIREKISQGGVSSLLNKASLKAVAKKAAIAGIVLGLNSFAGEEAGNLASDFLSESSESKTKKLSSNLGKAVIGSALAGMVTAEDLKRLYQTRSLKKFASGLDLKRLAVKGAILGTTALIGASTGGLGLLALPALQIAGNAALRFLPELSLGQALEKITQASPLVKLREAIAKKTLSKKKQTPQTTTPNKKRPPAWQKPPTVEQGVEDETQELLKSPIGSLLKKINPALGQRFKTPVDEPLDGARDAEAAEDEDEDEDENEDENQETEKEGEEEPLEEDEAAENEQDQQNKPTQKKPRGKKKPLEPSPTLPTLPPGQPSAESEQPEEGENGEEEENEEEEEEEEEEQSNESARQSKLQASKQKSRMDKSAEMLESVVGKEKMGEIRGETQEMAKKAFMKWAKSAIEGLTTNICNAFDLGTVGTTTIGTIFVYALTLTDLNAQMIWGYYIKHGKSFLIPPLEWDPIPVPKVIFPVQILHAGLVLIDIFVIGTIVIMFSLIVLILFLPQIILAGSLLSIASWLYFLKDFVL